VAVSNWMQTEKDVASWPRQATHSLVLSLNRCDLRLLVGLLNWPDSTLQTSTYCESRNRSAVPCVKRIGINLIQDDAAPLCRTETPSLDFSYHLFMYTVYVVKQLSSYKRWNHLIPIRDSRDLRLRWQFAVGRTVTASALDGEAIPFTPQLKLKVR